MWTDFADHPEYRSIPQYNKGTGGSFITGAIVSEIFPEIQKGRCDLLAKTFNEVCPKYTLDRPVVFHEFVATCGEESQSFTVFEEKLFYRAPRIMEVWKSRFPTLASAKPYEANPEKLANHVYANRNGNGDEASGDGFKFRGGGAIQLTGRDMYAKYAAYVKKDIDEVVKLVRNDIKWAIDSACWVFAIEKQLLDEAEKDEFATITKRVNGGLTNFDNRKKILARAMKALPIKITV